jgi:ASC-1-like (ASCH) protein
MSRQHHHLKCENEYYQAQEKGTKTFEVRKNDRDYQLYDMVYLEETVNGIKTGRKLPQKEIVYILHGGKYGIETGYCVMQLR